MFGYMNMVSFEGFRRFPTFVQGADSVVGAVSTCATQRDFRREVHQHAGGVDSSEAEEVDERASFCRRKLDSRHHRLGAVRLFCLASGYQRPGLHFGDASAQIRIGCKAGAVGGIGALFEVV